MEQQFHGSKPGKEYRNNQEQPVPGSKSGKEYIKAIYCHPAYLTYMQSTS